MKVKKKLDDGAGNGTGEEAKPKKAAMSPSVAFDWELWRAHIHGTTPLMQLRMDEKSAARLNDKTVTVHVQGELPRDVAERAAYRDKKGRIVHPSDAIVKILAEAGRNHKQRASKRQLKYIIPAAVRMSRETIPILGEDGKQLTDFEVDVRTGVNKTTKGRVLITRPRYDAWESQFTMNINRGIIAPEMVQQLLVEGGVMLGLGSFRPEKGGKYGTFQVTLFEKVDEPAPENAKKNLNGTSSP